MKVFEINSVPYGSTGRIMFQIADKVVEQGGEVITSCSYTKSRKIILPEKFYPIGGAIGKLFHIKLAELTGRHGCYSKMSTRKLIKKINKENPDIIHIHNIHGWFVNIPLLFDYFRICNKPIVWTLHDCWAYTGHCPFYTLAKCTKWKNGCFKCAKYMEYPRSYIDDSKFQYYLKKKTFTKIKNLTIVTPSFWLANEVKQSFLSEYTPVVINNGIDTTIFKPTKNVFKEKYEIVDKIMLLGVAFDWGERKGLQFFERLAKELDDRYQIVLVGLKDSQAKNLSNHIILISSTQNQMELAEIYSAADVFINPTLEDNFPTVNIEALACGTPVVTFQTGGSTEMLDDSCGWVVPYGNYTELKKVVQSIDKKTERMVENCINRGKKYKKDDKYLEYIELFNAVAGVRKNEF